MPLATIFVNVSSGWDDKEDVPSRLREWFEAKGWQTDIQTVSAGVNLAGLSREAVARGSDLVVAGGGDGTLSAVAAGLVGEGFEKVEQFLGSVALARGVVGLVG